MKRKGLCLLIALSLGGVAIAAQAQDAQNGTTTGTQNSTSTVLSTQYDGRWYYVPTIGLYVNDRDRNTNSRQVYYGIAVGKFIAPNTSLDLFFDRTRRDRDVAGHWANNNYGVSVRFYGGTRGSWRPYALAGLMGSRHINASDHGWSPAAELGMGVSKAVDDSADIRFEAAYRYDWDDKTQPQSSGYGDWLLGFSIVSRFGTPPAPPPPPEPMAPPPPPPPTCDQLDSDHDNVNNCVDKCPNSPSGSIVDPTGCPQKVVIDLRGVNFKFDRPSKGETTIAPTLKEPTSDSMAILKQAVDTLSRYPQVKVEVDGYTDSIGTDAYNQKLSQRRAQIVYNYLTSHGIDASRLEGPTGFGETHPVATNKTKDGRARNRRVELKVDQSTTGAQQQSNNGM